VFDILDALFGGWSKVGRMIPARRNDILEKLRVYDEGSARALQYFFE